jgi:hypothetical protein
MLPIPAPSSSASSGQTTKEKETWMPVEDSKTLRNMEKKANTAKTACSHKLESPRKINGG